MNRSVNDMESIDEILKREGLVKMEEKPVVEPLREYDENMVLTKMGVV